MASIVKRKRQTKKGEVTKYYISYRDIYGKQHTTGGYKTLAEAKKHINDFENCASAESEITLKNIFDLFWIKSKKYANSTQIMYERYYKKYFKIIENIKYKKLTSIQLQTIFDDIEKDSIYSAIICLKMCKSAVNNAIKKRMISTNKFNDIDKIKEPKVIHNHLSIKQIKLLLELAKNGIKGFEKQRKKYYTMLYVFIGTGMRAGEVLALNVNDFHYETKTLIVNKQFSKNELKATKTDTSNRKVYIFQELADVIEDYKKEVKGEILFSNETGGYMNLRNFGERYWKRLKEIAGITDRLRIHDLRGSYIDMLLSSGLSPKFAQNQVGHSKTQTTLDVYAQNNTDMIQIANNKINDIFNKCCTNVVQKSKTEKTNIISFSAARLKRTKKEPFGS